MALSSLGYPSDHPVIAKGMAGFENFAIEEGDTVRIQACISPLWDTALAMTALLDSGVPPEHHALVSAGRYLLDEQNLSDGDWQVRAKGVPPGGWAFEFHNEVYPDLDDTAEVVLALDRVGLSSSERKATAIDQAVDWTLGMQCQNGGWGSFDKDNTKTIVSKIPFADFGEAIDPPSVDVTAHILEMLGRLGFRREHPAVARALEYVFSEQEDDGPWFGRWGVNYIYGAGAVLPALEALGMDMSQEPVRRAVRWIIERQNSDGGWGESCSSYVDFRARGRGPSTPSQTAWALLALISAGEEGDRATRRGVEHLLTTQHDGGSWDEPYFTGTGFPGYGVGQRLERYLTPDEPGYQSSELPAGFMISYHLYRNYWPLMALGRYRRALNGERSKGSRAERRVAAGA
jgi:squalene-hopene/tetraprenyl-beta-curcumene cyclase